MISNLREKIYQGLSAISVIDTHEHLWDESWRLEHPGDWSSLFWHYIVTPLASVGMTGQESALFYAPETPHDEKWSIFAKYFPLVRNDVPMKAALIAIRDIYGIDRVDSDSMAALTVKIRDAVKPGFHRRILHEMAGIDYCMVNCFDRDEFGNRYPARLWGDTDLMRPDLYGDQLILQIGRKSIEQETCVDCSTLNGWLRAMDTYFERYAGQCNCIKIGLGYCGPLDFDESVTREAAEKLFIENLAAPMEYGAARPLVDYIFFQLLKRSAEYGLPLKFHTGMYSDGAEVDVISGNVRDLVKLAVAHPEVNFIVMHMAYPFQDQLVVAAKQQRNIYADMAWAWVLDMESSIHFLKKALTAVPVSKIMAFGGDYSLVENTYGHMIVARQGISQALAELVESGYFSVDEALEMGRFILRESASLLYPCRNIERDGGQPQ